VFERMLDKDHPPNVCELEKYAGRKATKYFHGILRSLERAFEIGTELKFPFGNGYGWGFKVSRKTKHLFYVFFEKGAITVTIQLRKIETELGKRLLSELSEQGREYWDKRYPCGDGGGWIHYRVLSDAHFLDVGRLVMIKLNRELDWELK
jgi:hypothetical protein